MPKEIFTPQNPETLEKIAAALESIGLHLRASASGMKAIGIEVLDVTHYDSLTKGMSFLTAFDGAVRQAVLKLQGDRGDFAAGPSKLNGATHISPKKKKGGRNAKGS